MAKKKKTKKEKIMADLRHEISVSSTKKTLAKEKTKSPKNPQSSVQTTDYMSLPSMESYTFNKIQNQSIQEKNTTNIDHLSIQKNLLKTVYLSSFIIVFEIIAKIFFRL